MLNHKPTQPSNFVLNKLLAYTIDPREGRIYNADGVEVGSVGPYGYVVITFWDERKKPKVTKRSHIVWWKHHGRWPTQQLDHDNRIRSDDRIDNLFEVRERKQQQNKQRKDGLLTGTGYSGDKFVARFWNGKTNKYLGTFDTVEEAHQVYLKATEEFDARVQ